MKATETSLLEFFRQPMQLMIPNPERPYRWTEEQCQKLWDDIIRVAEDDPTATHYIGTILYIEHGILKRTSVPKLILLDGQQRLISVSLLLAALGKKDSDTKHTDARHKEINDLFLFNSREKGEFYCKLIPPQGDSDTFFSLINNEEPPPSASGRLIENYLFFKNKIDDCGVDTGLVYKGIAKLTIIGVSTDRIYENPQSVYQSLTATGLDKTQSDLVRNWLGLLKSAS